MRPERAAGRRPVGTGEALRAVHRVASDHGLPTATAVVLHATNNVVVDLAPAPVVAKVSRSVRTAAREIDASRRSDLRRAVNTLSEAALARVTGVPAVLHGEPHTGNVLATSAGVRFCDFEGVCRGPLEWDLAFVPPDCVPAFGGIDVGLVDLLRGVVSAHVATLCWAKLRVLDDDGERRHAEHHLARAIEAARALQ